MLTSYHVHSTFSDGRNSIIEILEMAMAMGLDEIGISDHYVLLSNGETVSWSMPLNNLDTYFETIKQSVKLAGNGVNVRYGLEVDFDPNTTEKLNPILSKYPFDYIIGSVHFFNGFPIDECKESWDSISETDKDNLIIGYWGTIEKMARSGLYDIAAHLDLYKKFGHMPTTDISSNILSALEAVKEAGMAVEINTSGWHKPIQEAYPSESILQECYKMAIPVVITADAHSIEDLTRDYEKAAQVLRGIGYTNSVIFKDRKQTIVNL